jgi:hypothetical protein
LQPFEYVNGVGVDVMMMAQGALQGTQPGMVPSHATQIGQQPYLAQVSQYHSVSPASLPQFATSTSQFVAAAAPPHYVTSSHHHQV